MFEPNSIIDQVNKTVSASGILLRPTADNINIQLHNERKDFILKMEMLEQELKNAMSAVADVIRVAQNIQKQELSMMESLLQTDNDFTIVRKSKKAEPKQPTNDKGKTEPLPIKIGDHTVKALVVQSFDKVQQDGNLYYIEKNNHFAIKIAGLLLHGNIGKIYNDDKNPEKVKECKFGVSCGRTDCPYYHDPLSFPVSKDVRNFIAQSWLYSPSNTRTNPQARKYGASQFLELDIASGITKNDVQRYLDQIMHDLLCSIIAYKFAK